MMPQQVRNLCVFSIGRHIQRRAIVADRIYLGAAEKKFPDYIQVAIESSFAECGIAQIFAGVNIRASIQEITHDVEPAFTGRQVKRQAAISARINVSAGQTKYLHPAIPAVHDCFCKRALPSLLCRRQDIHNRQREHHRARECVGSRQ